MAKEFKNFDTMFSKAEIEACRKQWLFSGSTAADRNGYVVWNHRVYSWSNGFIRNCVYLAKDQLEWQLFRVSLKGLTTSEKLYMLDNRYATLVVGDAEYDELSSVTEDIGRKDSRERCRIDNYIGALVRGGQLSVGTYKVLK